MRSLCLALALTFAVAGCGGGERDSCTEGMSASCECSDGRMGARRCIDGRYGDCDCDGKVGDGGMAGADGSRPDVDGGTDRDGGGPDGDGGTTDGGESCATEGARRCGARGEERCVDGHWAKERPCPARCSEGRCDDGTVSCTPGAMRCFRNSVQRCNRDGTAWLFDSVCPEGCEEGLCVGECTPDADRCNGDELERCASDGSEYETVETCERGCDRRVCVEEGYVNEGLSEELSGRHVYDGCVEIRLGGTVTVPAGETLEIWARCLEVSASSSLELAAGAALRFHALETIDLAGTASGGDELFLEALDALSLTGSVSSDTTILRADALTIGGEGTTAGASLNAALYGRSFTNDGSHGGIVSVMPPAPTESPTHPSTGVWNLGDDDLVVAWERPFPSAMGYYVSVGAEVPGPGAGQYREDEYVVIDPSELRPGENRIRVVSVNADSEVGTFPQELTVTLNVRPPSVSSSSHPDPSAWGGPADVHLSWTDPADVPDGALVGYLYAFDRMADTVPGPADTFDDRNMRLYADRDEGIWYFHIVNLDRMGRPSPLVAHYPVRIGPEPGYGNVAGTITEADGGDPIGGATVRLNGGVLRTASGPTGDYTFGGEVPAADEPYTLTVRASGYAPERRSVSIGEDTAAVEHFELEADPDAVRPPVKMRWAFPVSDANAGSPDLAFAGDRAMWSRVESREASGEEVHLTDAFGDEVHQESTLVEYYDWSAARTDVGVHDGLFFAVDFYKCRDDGSLGFGHGWSCLRMRTWDRSGEVQAGWQRWRNSGHTGSPSAVWNGSSYGVFFISYGALYHRELTADLAFADGGDAATNDLLSGSHNDSRQFARTAALWDGDGYAVAWSIGRSSDDGTGALFFGRWDRTADTVTSPMEVDEAPRDRAIGLAWDGTSYHLAYQRSADDDVVLRTVERDGTLGTPTVLAAGAVASRWQMPSVAFDGRALLVTYLDGSGEGHLDVRDPSDYTRLQRVRLGQVWAPRVAVDRDRGVGAVLYTSESDGTWLHPFELR